MMQRWVRKTLVVMKYKAGEGEGVRRGGGMM